MFTVDIDPSFQEYLRPNLLNYEWIYFWNEDSYEDPTV